MKKIISGLLLVLLFLFSIGMLFKPFYDAIIENGWKGFFVALIAIKTFIDFLQKHGFKLFGYYRIVAGVAILLIHFFVQKLTII